jgi:hypothetical protein
MKFNSLNTAASADKTRTKPRRKTDEELNSLAEADERRTGYKKGEHYYSSEAEYQMNKVFGTDYKRGSAMSYEDKQEIRKRNKPRKLSKAELAKYK